jgi:hypothetical protein
MVLNHYVHSADETPNRRRWIETLVLHNIYTTPKLTADGYDGIEIVVV